MPKYVNRKLLPSIRRGTLTALTATNMENSKLQAVFSRARIPTANNGKPRLSVPKRGSRMAPRAHEITRQGFRVDKAGVAAWADDFDHHGGSLSVRKAPGDPPSGGEVCASGVGKNRRAKPPPRP
jgi:hypothetical protein